MNTSTHEDCDVGPPVGKCYCGCGGTPNLAARTDRKRGWTQGQPLKYLRGHNARKTPHHIAVPTGHETDCWIWQLAKDRGGYGLARLNGKTVLAHRARYIERYGSIPDGLQLDHLCSMRACIRPEHLEPVTQRENVRRGRGTKLDAQAVKQIRESPDTQHVIARRYGISQSQVSRICSGKSWT